MSRSAPPARAASTMTEPARGEAQRVVEQVVDGLADPVRVDAARAARPGRRRGRSARPAASRGRGEIRAAREQRAGGRPALEPEAEPVVVASGEQQQVVGDPGQPVGLVGRAAHRGGQLAPGCGPAGPPAPVRRAARRAACAARGWRRRRTRAAVTAPAAAGRAGRSSSRPARRSRPWSAAPRCRMLVAARTARRPGAAAARPATGRRAPASRRRAPAMTTKNAPARPDPVRPDSWWRRRPRVRRRRPRSSRDGPASGAAVIRVFSLVDRLGQPRSGPAGPGSARPRSAAGGPGVRARAADPARGVDDLDQVLTGRRAPAAAWLPAFRQVPRRPG